MSIRSIRHAAALGTVLATVVAAAPALAHAPVRGTFPKNGATVAPLRTVSVRFGESVVTGTIAVSRQDGSAVAARVAGLDPRNKARLRATFRKKLARGRYVVRWRALADDGHRERGSFRFRVR